VARFTLLPALLLTMLAPTWATESETLRAGSFDPPRQAPEITLEGTNGAALKLSEYRGKVVLLGFGFTSCANVCPVTLAVLAQARKKLGAQANQVQVVYITVDPERDNAERLRNYLNAFDKQFVGGTGPPQRLAEVRKAYGVSAEKVITGNTYQVAHSSFIYLIDKQGRIRALMPFGHTADDYVHDLKLLLKSP
jgi:protein SCO1